MRLAPLLLSPAMLVACGDATGPSLAPGVPALALGARHACQLIGGVPTCWGTGDAGQLGIGSTPGDTTPVLQAPGVVLTSITAGATHTCGLDGGGRAWCWGSNQRGELGTDMPDEQCGGIPCRTTPVPVAAGTRFQSLTAGVSFTCGLSTGGTIYCWGLNDTGQLGTTADSFACGGIRCSTEPVPAADGRRFVTLSAGLSHVCALDAGGEAWCWGYDGLPREQGGPNGARFLPEPRRTGGPRFRLISAGGYHTCAVTRNGTAWCWGVDALGAGPNLREAHDPVRVQTDRRFTRLALGRYTSCALDRAGRAWCWGANVSGEVGTTPVGANQHFDTPSAVSGEPRYSDIAGGAETYCGITTAGATACWGRGRNGELGSGAMDSPVPVIVPLPGT